jgi:glycosyltransferase involved in cell wall biosynthesis
MKIGIVQPLAGKVGGNEKVLDEIINALSNHELTLYTFSKPFKNYNIPTVSTIPFKLPMMGIYQKLMLPKFDFSKEDLILTTVPIKTEKPVIFYDQNNEFDKSIPRKYRTGFWKLYYQPYKFLRRYSKINKNTKYFACSDYSSSLVSNTLGVKCDTLYPSISLDGVFEDKKIKQVCVMGRITAEKNLEQTIDILNQLDCNCVIAGTVDKANKPYLAKLKKLAKPHIKFTTNISRQEFLSIMAESKVYFSASKETLGITTIEAIGSGCIPVVPDHSAHPEIVTLSTFRYKDSNEALTILLKALKTDMTSIIRDDLRKSISKFNHDDFKDKLIKIVEESIP